MPYEWTEPETFMKHDGVRVYHTYKGGPGNECRQTYMFTLDPCQDDVESGGEFQFDVRDLPVSAAANDCAGSDERHKRIIADAIDNGDVECPQGNAPPRDPVQKVLKLLEDDGREASDLDEVVHDLKSKDASAINNAGLPEQVDYIIECGVTLDELSGILAGSLKA